MMIFSLKGDQTSDAHCYFRNVYLDKTWTLFILCCLAMAVCYQLCGGCSLTLDFREPGRFSPQNKTNVDSCSGCDNCVCLSLFTLFKGITGVQFFWIELKPVRRVANQKRFQNKVHSARQNPTLNMGKFRVGQPIATFICTSVICVIWYSDVICHTPI